MSEMGDVPAGDFSAWVSEMQEAIRGDRASDVPCNGCTACCTASQFIHIAPDESDTLAHIPAELLFPAPRSPRGHVLMGYDERGHCPMLVDGRCSIYEHRPRTCRTYDCRIFPATGLEPDDDKVEIAARARRWQFDYPTDDDRIRQEALRAAAAHLQEHADLVPDGIMATNATQLAVVAVEAHGAFLERDRASGSLAVVAPGSDAIRVELTRRT
jgi:Fe-S-cluster containining protein